MNNETVWIILLVFFVAGAVIPYGLNKNRNLALVTGCLFAVAGSTTALWMGVRGLVSSDPILILMGNILPITNLEFYIDGLSGFFLITIALVSILTSIYSIQYMKIYGQENLAWWSFCYNLFLLTMMLVVTANNIIVFLIFWEMMTLASYFLVTFSFKREQVRKAGFVYLVMTHIGTVFIASALFLLAGSQGGWNYAHLAAGSGMMNDQTKNLIFVCALIGFGTKAGIVPLHIWLPQAHPAAPTNVSALMSGVMLKTAIYGIVRLMIDLLGTGPSWWGAVIIVLGVISALVGVVSALMEHDLKRLLAYHSVENIGIILMGVGTSMVFYSWSMPVPAAIALAAGLFHVLNHAIFKSLLFLCTGSVYYATHTKDIEQLGGLIKKMPVTSILFLTGAISISAVPPFNGFASEYQLYLSLLQLSHQHQSNFWVVGGILGCTALALTGALAAACFVKAFGISFLALPRSAKATGAREVPWNMTLSMIPLAALCLILGGVSGQMMNLLAQIAVQLKAGSPIPLIGTYPYQIFLLFGFVIVILFGLTKLSGAGKERKSQTWGCGIETNAEMEYTAASFSQPIRRVYRPLLKPTRSITTGFNGQPYFGYRIEFHERIGSNFKDYFYVPVRKSVIEISRKWQNIQSGNINWYLGYIFVTLIILLVFCAKG
ncbi:MAG: hydrogenase 4 subunit B [Peptococcaceae bacterium]|nr:hydrogenase 4 subunit B [Peptococcaceae bacterium]